MELNRTQRQGEWKSIADTIDLNFGKVATEVESLNYATRKNKGYFATVDALTQSVPTAKVGEIAYVGTSSPFTIYIWRDGWVNTGYEHTDSVELGNYVTADDFATSQSNLQEQINNHGDEIESLKEDNQNITTEIDNIKEAISNSGGSSGGSSEVTRAEFELVRTQTETNKSDIASLAEDVNAMSGDISNLEQSDEDLSNGIIQAENRLDERIDKVRDGLESEITRAKGAEQSLSDRIDNLENNGEGGSAEIEVIDNLTSTSKTAALSANQGKVLNGKIEDLQGQLEADAANLFNESQARINDVAALQERANSTESQVAQLNTRAQSLSAEIGRVELYTGVEEYPLYDDAQPYSVGDIVRLSTNELRRFTADYNGSGTPQYEPWNLVLDTERAKTPDNMGYVILRKGISFTEQVTKENTIYEVRYEFDLGGKTVTTPSGCVLKFNGGRIANGTIVGNETIIEADAYSYIFENVKCIGIWSVDKASICWFGAVQSVNSPNISCNGAIRTLLEGNFNTMYIPNGSWYVDETIEITKSVNIELYGNGTVLNNKGYELGAFLFTDKDIDVIYINLYDANRAKDIYIRGGQINVKKISGYSKKVIHIDASQQAKYWGVYVETQIYHLNPVLSPDKENYIFSGTAIYINGGNEDSKAGGYVTQVVVQSIITGFEYGIKVDGYSGKTWITDIVDRSNIKDCQCAICANYGSMFRIEGSYQPTFISRVKANAYSLVNLNGRNIVSVNGFTWDIGSSKRVPSNEDVKLTVDTVINGKEGVYKRMVSWMIMYAGESITIPEGCVLMYEDPDSGENILVSENTTTTFTEKKTFAVAKETESDETVSVVVNRVYYTNQYSYDLTNASELSVVGNAQTNIMSAKGADLASIKGYGYADYNQQRYFHGYNDMQNYFVDGVVSYTAEIEGGEYTGLESMFRNTNNTCKITRGVPEYDEDANVVNPMKFTVRITGITGVATLLFGFDVYGIRTAKFGKADVKITTTKDVVIERTLDLIKESAGGQYYRYFFTELEDTYTTIKELVITFYEYTGDKVEGSVTYISRIFGKVQGKRMPLLESSGGGGTSLPIMLDDKIYVTGESTDYVGDLPDVKGYATGALIPVSGGVLAVNLGRGYWQYIYANGTTQAQSTLPDKKVRGDSFFNTSLQRPIWYNGTNWVTSDGRTYTAGKTASSLMSGTFANKDNTLPVGESYFCTDRKTAEGDMDGIIIYHKGNGVWVDALGRIVE